MKFNRFIIPLLLITASGCNAKKEELRKEQPSTQQQQQPGAIPRYNPKTVEKIKGQIVNIIRVNYPDARPGYEIQILVRTADGDIPVRLGPGWFIEEGPHFLMPQDEVEIKGSRLYLNGMVFIVAQELKSGKFVLKLRDDKGNPLWTGWRED